MVVGLILEIHKPLFLFAVHLHRDNNRAGIDLIGLFLIRKLALSLQTLCSDKSDVHQADELIIAVLIENLEAILIIMKCIFDWLPIESLIEFYRGKLCGEGGMTAMVRPVGI